MRGDVPDVLFIPIEHSSPNCIYARNSMRNAPPLGDPSPLALDQRPPQEIDVLHRDAPTNLDGCASFDNLFPLRLLARDPGLRPTSVPISKSAGIRSPTLSRRIIASVRFLLPPNTSDTLARLPIIGSRSFRISPCWSIPNSIIAIGSASPIGKCFCSYASTSVTSASSSSPSAAVRAYP